MNNKKLLFLFSLIFLLALFLRVFLLNKAPVSLFGDELDVGDQAYSVLQTGKDYFGNSFPLMFHSYAEQRLPVFIYSDVLFVGIFGLNEWGVRLNGVFWGMLGILGIFLLSKELFKENKIALLSALLLAISPWHLQYSRQGGIESGVLLSVIIFASWAFFKGAKNYKYLLLSAGLFSFSVYTYATAALFIPFLVLLLFLLNFKKIWALGVKKLSMAILLGLIVLSPYLFLFVSGKSSQRFSTISILSDQSLIDDIDIKRKMDNSPDSIIFHNKAQVFIKQWVGNYLEAFSPQFLFTKGDPNLRHSVGGMGEFYVFEVFTILFGIVFLFKNESREKRILLFGWLILSPVASSLTSDGAAHASRLMFMLVPLSLFSSLGIYYLFQNRDKLTLKLLGIFLIFLSVFNISNYFHRYYVDWTKESWRFWQMGYKEAMTFIKENEGEYNRVYFNDTYESALPRFLFWYQYDPKVLRNQFTGIEWQKDIANHFDGYKIGDKYYFGTITQDDKSSAIERLLNSKQMYLVSARDEADFIENKTPLGSLKILKTIFNPYGKPIFYIVTK